MTLPEPYYDDGRGIVIYHGDAREILPLLSKVDLVLTDPPYGTGGRRRLSSGQGASPKSAVVKEDWDTSDLSWLRLLPDCPWMIFWPSGGVFQLLEEAVRCGRTKHRELFWKKSDPMPQPGGQAAFSVEPIWLLTKNGHALRGSDWFEASTPRQNRDSDAFGHPYQKPIEVMRWLILLTDCTTILDPFMGSGTTLRAAKDLGRKAIGIEINEEYCAIAKQRLAQEVLGI